MGLGSYILYLRAHRDGITPREVAAEIEMPEHYIHAIELEKHAGDADSRGKLAEYFELSVEEFGEMARSTHNRFLESLKKERRPQMGFLLMSGETLLGTVDGADSSIVKIVELNSGTKTILQRHAIKKWWPLKKPEAGDRERRPSPMGQRTGAPRPGGGQDRRPPMGSPRPVGGQDRRPPMVNPYPGGGQDRRPPMGSPHPSGGQDRRPPTGGNKY